MKKKSIWSSIHFILFFLICQMAYVHCENYTVQYWGRLTQDGFSQPLEDLKPYKENASLGYYKLFLDASNYIKCHEMRKEEVYGIYTFDEQKRIKSYEVPTVSIHRIYNYESGENWDYTIKSSAKDQYTVEYYKKFQPNDILVKTLFYQNDSSIAVQYSVFDDQWREIQFVKAHLVQNLKSVTYFEYRDDKKIATHVDNFDASELKTVETYFYDENYEQRAYNVTEAKGILLSETIYDRANDQIIERQYHKENQKKKYERIMSLSQRLLLSEHEWDLQGRKTK